MRLGVGRRSPHPRRRRTAEHVGDDRPPGLAEPIEVGSGHHEWTYDVADDVVAGWRDEAWDPGP